MEALGNVCWLVSKDLLSIQIWELVIVWWAMMCLLWVWAKLSIIVHRYVANKHHLAAYAWMTITTITPNLWIVYLPKVTPSIILSIDCPNSTYPYSGLCMKCPPQCQTCTLDLDLHIAFLKCLTCKPGYLLTYGHCMKQCLSY